MNKNSAFIFFIFSFLLFTCDDEPLEGEFENIDTSSCEFAINNVATAQANFANATDDNYTEVCEAYKLALQARIDVCGDETGSTQALITELGSCTPPTDTCAEAVIKVNEAQDAFDDANDTNYTELCNALKEELQNAISACNDTNGNYQGILDQLDEDCVPGEVMMEASLIGTWRITSLTSNGEEELQDELDAFDICFWEETYTNTELTVINFSGDDCEETSEEAPEAYMLENNIISFEDDTSVEIIELTDTTLRYQDVYEEEGEMFTDIYTLVRQFDEPIGDISVVAGTLDVTFDIVTIEVTGSVIMVSGETSVETDHTIYFEINQGVEGVDVINNFTINLTTNYVPVTGGGSLNFSSEINTNTNISGVGTLEGTFNGLVVNADSGQINLTEGSISLKY